MFAPYLSKLGLSQWIIDLMSWQRQVFRGMKDMLLENCARRLRVGVTSWTTDKEGG